MDIVFFVLQKLHTPFNRTQEKNQIYTLWVKPNKKFLISVANLTSIKLYNNLYSQCYEITCFASFIEQVSKIIYAISIITPLTRIMHFNWFRAHHMMCLLTRKLCYTLNIQQSMYYTHSNQWTRPIATADFYRSRHNICLGYYKTIDGLQTASWTAIFDDKQWESACVYALSTTLSQWRMCNQSINDCLLTAFTRAVV